MKFFLLTIEYKFKINKKSHSELQQIITLIYTKSFYLKTHNSYFSIGKANWARGLAWI